MKNLSAIIITKNEALNIERCISAIKHVTKEIIVIDAFSTDETVKIAEENGAWVIQKKWEGYSKTKNFGITKSNNDWILSIDADEVLSGELIQSINNLTPVNGFAYELDRINNFCGKWINHSGWYPDWKIRLFNKTSAYWVGAFVHEKLKFTKPTEIERLKGKLYHFSYDNLEDHNQRIEKYATLSAAEMHAKGIQSVPTKMYLSPIVRFLKTLVIKRAFLDGKNGWIISRRNAKLVYLKYKKLKALNNERL